MCAVVDGEWQVVMVMVMVMVVLVLVLCWCWCCCCCKWHRRGSAGLRLLAARAEMVMARRRPPPERGSGLLTAAQRCTFTTTTTTTSKRAARRCMHHGRVSGWLAAAQVAGARASGQARAAHGPQATRLEICRRSLSPTPNSSQGKLPGS